MYISLHQILDIYPFKTLIYLLLYPSEDADDISDPIKIDRFKNSYYRYKKQISTKLNKMENENEMHKYSLIKIMKNKME